MVPDGAAEGDKVGSAGGAPVGQGERGDAGGTRAGRSGRGAADGEEEEAVFNTNTGAY